MRDQFRLWAATTLGLPGDATPDDIADEISRLKKRSLVFAAYRDELIEVLVQDAISGGKLHEDERDWGVGEAKKDPGVFLAFLKFRPISGAADAVQREMNRMLHISAETFRKYNPRSR